MNQETSQIAKGSLSIGWQIETRENEIKISLESNGVLRSQTYNVPGLQPDQSLSDRANWTYLILLLNGIPQFALDQFKDTLQAIAQGAGGVDRKLRTGAQTHMAKAVIIVNQIGSARCQHYEETGECPTTLERVAALRGIHIELKTIETTLHNVGATWRMVEAITNPEKNSGRQEMFGDVA